ncbi:MAG: hypothetical protein HY906_14805 [Deltaproteobacteria bacterium]|nr:hypothetical protein [Deltaproteobacteria bacterium]
MGGVRVKGTALLSTKQFLVDRYGADGMARTLAVLSGAERDLVERRLQAALWYPFEHWIHLCEAAATVLNGGDLALCREMGRYGGLKDLRVAVPHLLQTGDPLQLVAFAPQLWSLYYDSGRVEIAGERPGYFELFVRDFGHPHEGHCLRVAGWIDACIELYSMRGGTEILGCRARGDAECKFRATWSAPATAPAPAAP